MEVEVAPSGRTFVGAVLPGDVDVAPSMLDPVVGTVIASLASDVVVEEGTVVAVAWVGVVLVGATVGGTVVGATVGGTVVDSVVGAMVVDSVAGDVVVSFGTVGDGTVGVVVEFGAVDVLVVVVESAMGAQNWTFETSGWLPLPTSGRPSFEKTPWKLGGLNDMMTALGPPLTMTSAMATSESQVPPVADPLVIVTACSFPSGLSKL